MYLGKRNENENNIVQRNVSNLREKNKMIINDYDFLSEKFCVDLEP